MRIERITVGEGSLDAFVRLEPSDPPRSDESLASRAIALLPGLVRHRCDNAGARTFAAEARDTELPHLLEHVACELMALAGSPRSLGGETAWDFARDGRGAYRVTLRFDDDLVALGALKAANELLAALLADEEPPDVEATAARLRGLRER